MRGRYIWWGGLGLVALAAAGFGAWMLSLPVPRPFRDPPAIGQQEAAATLAALKPPKRPRPLVAIVGINDATEPGVDEVSLALVADAWSRTYRSRALTFSPTGAAQQSRNGIRFLPDQVAASWPAPQRLPPIGPLPPARALDQALASIAARYGSGTAQVVAMELEYPQPPAGGGSGSSSAALSIPR